LILKPYYPLLCKRRIWIREIDAFGEEEVKRDF
jgi:hypothetical protein